MKAKYYDSIDNITVLVGEDDYFYSFQSDERWNGEYYKGWRSTNHGDEACPGKWYVHIRPVYKKVGEDFELNGYKIEQV